MWGLGLKLCWGWGRVGFRAMICVGVGDVWGLGFRVLGLILCELAGQYEAACLPHGQTGSRGCSKDPKLKLVV